MQVAFACLADHATADSAGKLTVSGIFDRIGSEKFPTRHGKMFLVFRSLHEYQDNNQEFPLRIVLRDEDSKEIIKIEAKMKITDVPAGKFRTHNHIVELNDMVFAESGRYEFVIRIGKSPAAVIPFDVDQL